jgi:SAM-dependent MidA family methyltransferase
MMDDINSQLRKEALTGLPPPDLAAQEHSIRLQHMIIEEIEAYGGRISFARFMELALYTPGLGYYSGGSHKLGQQGDFITAPEYSPLFSCCLARQVEQVFAIWGGGDVLEVGAGSGAMAADLLESLAAVDCLPNRYFILERSGELRARQQALLLKRLPHLQNHIAWVDRLPERGFRGVILANELLDALPVHCFILTEEGYAELYVKHENDQWQWCRGTPSSAELAKRIERIRREEKLSAGYHSEINLAGEAWIRSIADMLTMGMLLVIDYGFTHHEYYHPMRVGGTLMCHYRHRAHGDPFLLVGLQDITAHVDFTAMAEAGHAAGLSVAGYTTQAAFLLALGITELMMGAENEQAHLRRAQQVKRLTLPHEMGELFKVMAFTRRINKPLLGFTLSDLRGRL